MNKIPKKMFQLYFNVLNLIWYKVMHCQFFHFASFFFVIAKFSPKIMTMHCMKSIHHLHVRFANQCLPKCLYQSSVVFTYFEWTLEFRASRQKRIFLHSNAKASESDQFWRQNIAYFANKINKWFIGAYEIQMKQKQNTIFQWLMFIDPIEFEWLRKKIKLYLNLYLLLTVKF